MLDETWGLKDGEDKETSTPKVKRLNHGPIDDQFKKDFDGGHFKEKAFQKIIIHFGSDRLEFPPKVWIF